MNVLLGGDPPFTDELTALFRRAGHQVIPWAAEEPELPASMDLAVDVHHGDRAAKRRFIQGMDQAPETLLLVSALPVSVTEAASWSRAPERVVGFGVVPPLGETGLVELASGLQTAAPALEQARRFWRGVGYDPVLVQEGPGLVRMRVIACIINEAASALLEGVATARDLDTAMRLGTNYPHGPLAWADHLGLDTVLAVLEGLQAEWGEDRYRPSPLLRRLVLAGKLGKQSGEGFFVWAADQAQDQAQEQEQGESSKG